MSIVVPTITTDDPHEYREQMEQIASFSEGVHLDFADGEFAPTELMPLATAWRDDRLITHAHIMFQRPLEVIDDVMQLDADLVILHVESDDVETCLELLQENGTRTGLAILPGTSVGELRHFKDLFDHVLVFGGHLGYQGGEADLDELEKVKKVKQMFPDVEVAWDGGINKDNIAKIAEAGVTVLNVGGAIKKAKNPKKAYDELVSLVS
jgi:ribulose-phosphate 3-epimerase